MPEKNVQIAETEPATAGQLSGATPLAVSAVRGSMWVTLSVLVSQAVVLVSSIIMARILSPADFGWIEISISLAVLVNLVGEYGLSAEIIQRKTLTMEYLSTAFWTNVAIGVGLSILGIALAPIVEIYFDSPGMEYVLGLTALNFLVNGFGVVQRSQLIREMAFGKIAQIETAAAVSFAIVSIALVLAGWGVYSYVLGWLGRTLLMTVALFLNADWRPDWTFRWSLFKEIFQFGANVMMGRTIMYAGGNMDRFILWKGLGSTGLGYYGLARRTPAMLGGLLKSILIKVSYPTLARVRADRSKLKSVYLRIVQFSSYLVFPALFLMSVLAAPFIRVVFGPQWEPAIFPLRLFAISVCMTAPFSLGNSAFQAIGRPDLMWKNQAIRLAIYIPSILIGLRWGLQGVAISILLHTFVSNLVTQLLVHKAIDVSLMDVTRYVFATFRNSILAAVASGVVLIGLQELGMSDLPILIISGLTGGLTYLVTFRLLNLKELQAISGLFLRSVSLPWLKKYVRLYARL